MKKYAKNPWLRKEGSSGEGFPTPFESKYLEQAVVTIIQSVAACKNGKRTKEGFSQVTRICPIKKELAPMGINISLLIER